MKKSLALVLAAVMVLAVCGTAFAARDWANTPTSTITITGLENGDVVRLYKIIGWDNDAATNNWAALDAYSDVSGIDSFATMTKEKMEAIAVIAAGKTPVNGEDGTTVSGTSFTSSALPVGMYLALVSSAGQTVYNPMIVSVNFDSGLSGAKSSELNASSATMAETAVAKKTPITATKTVDADVSTDDDDDKTIKAGDVVPFIVHTQLPTYAESWDDPYFKVTDTLSAGLSLNADTISVAIAGITGSPFEDTTPNVLKITPNGTSGYEIDFDEALLKQVKGTPAVTITYTATVTDAVKSLYNVNRENNTVTVEFSNNPKDKTGHTTITERTNHYTFAIDANIVGSISGQDITSELVKIGVDDNGNVISEWLVSDPTAWEDHFKLAGATFTLTGKAGTSTAGYSETYTTTDSGHIKFKDLEAGEYTLTETKAPDGYVKDNAAAQGIPVVITATYLPDEVVNGVMEHHRLASYTITINGSATSTYYVTNNASDTVTTSSVSSDNETFPIVNTHGLELPSTGGIGTTIFYVAGLLMVLGAGTVLVARRKADQE